MCIMRYVYALAISIKLPLRKQPQTKPAVSLSKERASLDAGY